MKVLCLGAGGMGSLAAETIAGFKEIERITVADLYHEAAYRVVDKCRGKAAACSVNVEDRESLTGLMEGHDVVVNCVGPFFRFGPPVLECAISAGIGYFDICDDPGPTQEMLEMSKAAEDAGITAVVGLGASPGITNVLSSKVSRIFTRMTELHAAWNIEESGDGREDVLEYSAAIVHWMRQISGNIIECRAGKLEEVKPLEPVDLYYPGRGKRKVWTVGHPEPVAFARSYPGIHRSSCYMVMPESIASEFKKLSARIDDGSFTLEEAAHQLVCMSKDGSLVRRWAGALAHAFDGPCLPLLFVVGRGEIKGRNATVAATISAFPEGMARMTAIPLAIGVHQFAQGRIGRKGVSTPEEALDADAFFRELAPYCTDPTPPSHNGFLEIVQEFD